MSEEEIEALKLNSEIVSNASRRYTNSPFPNSGARGRMVRALKAVLPRVVRAARLRGLMEARTIAETNDQEDVWGMIDSRIKQLQSEEGK